MWLSGGLWRLSVSLPESAGAATRLQSHTTSNVANVSQRAALAAVSGDLESVFAMREAFDRRRRTAEHRSGPAALDGGVGRRFVDGDGEARERLCVHHRP